MSVADKILIILAVMVAGYQGLHILASCHGLGEYPDWFKATIEMLPDSRLRRHMLKREGA